MTAKMMAPRATKHEFLGAVTLLRFSASGALLYVGVGVTLFLYDVASGALLGRRAALSRGILHGCDCVDHLASDNAARRVGAFFGQKRVACFSRLPQSVQDAEEGGGDACFTRIGKQRVFRDWVFDVRVLTDDAQKLQVAVGLAHNFVQVWDPVGDCIERSVQCGERCILYAFAFHGRTLDELVVAAGTVFQHILLWNPAGTETGKEDAAVVQPSQRLHAHDGVIFKLAWSEDARQLASVSDDRTVQLWSNVQPSEEQPKHLDRDALLETPFSPVFRAWGHSARVWDVQFCAPNRLASASEDGVCKIWSVNGDCLATLTGHVGKHVWRVGVRQPTVTRGAVVATGGGDGAVKLWDVDQQIRAATTTTTPEQEASSSMHGYSRTISIAPPTAEDVHTGKRKSGAKAATATNSVRNILVNPLDGGATGFVATEHGEIFRVTLATGAWSRFFVVPADGKTNSLSTCTLGMGGLFLLLGDVHGHVFVLSTRTGELVYSWTAHEHARVMKIWWIHDEKSPSPYTVFTCSADGSLTEWTPEFEPSQPEMLVGMTSVATFRCSGKCAATSLVAMDRAATTRNVICGDGRGSVFVFHRPLTPSVSDKQDNGVDSAITPAAVLRAVHGREQVSTLLLDADEDDGNASRLFSGGHDGSICSLLVEQFDSADDTGAVTLRLVARESVKGLTTVKQLAWHAVSGDSPSRELMVFGFHASNAVLHNLSAQYRVFSLACGGWRRPHALCLRPDCSKGSASALPSHTFVFTPPTPQKGNLSVQITVHSTSTHHLEQSNNQVGVHFQQASLHDRYHGKMTTCVAFVDAKRLVTAAEDNSLMLHVHRLISKQDASSSRWTSVSSGVAHTTTVRALVSFRRRQSSSAIGADETILVSGGGKQRVNVWRVRDAGERNADVLQFVCGHEPSGALQDHRILGLTTFALVPSADEVSDRFRLVVGCNSEGAMPLLLVDLQSESITQLGELALPSKKPILSCAGVQRPCNTTSAVSVLAVGSTDGLVSLFNVSEWLARLSVMLTTNAALVAMELEALCELASSLEPANSFLAHDMGVNCMAIADAADSDDKMTLLSGGDDQSLRLSVISLATLQVEREATAVNASGSAIKAVASTGDAVFVGGYDQRVSMFRVVKDRGLALEWQCAAFSECADIADLSIKPKSEEDGGESTTVVVVGQGLQAIEFTH